MAKDKPARKIETKGEVARNKRGGYNSETYDPQTMKEFGLADSIREIRRALKGK